MKKSKNSPLTKNKFYNIYKGKNKYFFILPCISISNKKLFSWDLSLKSIFIALGNFYLQINIFEKIQNSSNELYKDNLNLFINFLKNYKLNIKNTQEVIDFLNKNSYIIKLINNSNLEHPYTKALLEQILYAQNIIKN
jgi:hypothetical protein